MEVCQIANVRWVMELYAGDTSHGLSRGWPLVSSDREERHAACQHVVADPAAHGQLDSLSSRSGALAR